MHFLREKIPGGPGCAGTETSGRGLGPVEKQLRGSWPGNCDWPPASEAFAQETLVATYLATQSKLISNLEATQQSIKSRPIPVV